MVGSVLPLVQELYLFHLGGVRFLQSLLILALSGIENFSTLIVLHSTNFTILVVKRGNSMLLWHLKVLLYMKKLP